MTVNEIRERARLEGLNLPLRMRKAEMVREIQRAEGHQDCFGAAWRFDCAWQHECCWKADCHAPSPG